MPTVTPITMVSIFHNLLNCRAVLEQILQPNVLLKGRSKLNTKDSLIHSGIIQRTQMVECKTEVNRLRRDLEVTEVTTITIAIPDLKGKGKGKGGTNPFPANEDKVKRTQCKEGIAQVLADKNIIATLLRTI